MLKIGEFSKLSKTTIKTLRYYDEIGLFKPSHVEENGYRFYTVEDLKIITVIRKLRGLNMSIEEIKKAISGNDLIAVLRQRSLEIEEEIAKQNRDLSIIDDIIKKLQKGDSIMNNYVIEKKRIPSFTAYYRHGKIDSMADIFKFVSDANAEAKENNPDLVRENYCYVTYEAQEYQENNVELEYVEAVKDKGVDSANMKFKSVEAIDAVCVAHKGNYSGLIEAYAYAVGYVKEHGYTIAGKIREVYIHGCWDRVKESDYLTEIQIPVK